MQILMISIAELRLAINRSAEIGTVDLNPHGAVKTAGKCFTDFDLC